MLPEDGDVTLFPALLEGVPTGFFSDIPVNNVFLPNNRELECRNMPRNDLQECTEFPTRRQWSSTSFCVRRPNKATGRAYCS